MRLRMVATLLALAPALAGAQERAGLPDLPRDVEARMRSMQTDPAATRLAGPVTIAGDRVVDGPLVVEGGSLILDGRVAGDLLVVGGDVHFGPGSGVEGDVLVVGGEIHGIEGATVGGTLLAYGPALDEHRRHPDRDDRRRAERRDDDPDDDDHDDRRRRHRHRDEGGLGLGVSVAGNYNRVEGLPVMFGPVVETSGPNSLHVAAQAIWRTQPSSSLDDEVGYRIRLDQGLFDDRLRLGGDFRSLARPIERRGLNSTESSLAAVLFHSDLHDYYDEQSWAVRLEARPGTFPVDASLTYRQATHSSLEVSNPWSLFDDDDTWRSQPVVAQGDVATLSLGVTLDTRDDDDEPTRGIRAFVGIERALEQDLAMPGIDLLGTVGGGLEFEDFTIASLDLRAHLPVNRSSTLNVRGVLEGTVDETVLPPQFQRALGGIGTLPGFHLFEGACGARTARVRMVAEVTDTGNELSEEPMLAAYGCDRIALAQFEYRGGFGFDVRSGHDDDDDDAHTDEEWWEEFHCVDLEADWAFFVDVARGWSFGDMTFVDRGDTETMADAGIGLLFDQAGVYVAMPITGDDRSLRMVVRLERRF